MTVGIVRPRHIKISTNAALSGRILLHGFNINTAIMSDDAGQFSIFQQVLCWIHIERNIAKLLPCNDSQAKAVAPIRTEIWALYQHLTRYKIYPNFEKNNKIQLACWFHHPPDPLLSTM